MDEDTGRSAFGSLGGIWMDRACPDLVDVPCSSLDKSPQAYSFGAAFLGREQVKAGFGEGRRDYLAFPGDLQGLYAHFRLSRDSAVSIGGEDLLKFHFKLSGNNTICFPGQDAVNIRGGCMAVAIHPRGVEKLDCHSHDVLEHSITFACRPKLLTETLRLDADLLPEPLRTFAQARDPARYLRVMPLTARVTKTIEDMLSCPYSGRLNHLHAEARALDLICMVLDVLVNEEKHSDVHLLPRDIRALENVRDFLATHYVDPPSIAELAGQAAMNRTKLNQGFRTLFNETVFDYVQRLRMQRARELLLAGLPVGNVSSEVGYEHHSSFAHAFHTYFGFSPVKLHRTNLRR